MPRASPNAHLRFEHNPTGISRALSEPPTLSRYATDTVLLGSLRPDALAAGGLGANRFFVVVTLLQGVLTSVSVSVSHARGEQAKERVPHI